MLVKARGDSGAEESVQAETKDGSAELANHGSGIKAANLPAQSGATLLLDIFLQCASAKESLCLQFPLVLVSVISAFKNAPRDVIILFGYRATPQWHEAPEQPILFWTSWFPYKKT